MTFPLYLMLDYQAVIKSDTATSLLNVSIFEYILVTYTAVSADLSGLFPDENDIMFSVL